MWKYILLAAIGLSGCGKDEVYIAKDMVLRLSFRQQLAELKVFLHPDYQVEGSASQYFEDFARVQVEWDEEQGQNYLRSVIKASPDELDRDWPAESFERFPNGRNFLAPMKGSELMIWEEAQAPLSLGLVYTREEDLSFGGLVRSDQFRVFPRRLYAYQFFKNDSGSIRATIVMMGPSWTNDGGLYFIAHLGDNPFVDSPDSEDLNYYLKATGPVVSNRQEPVSLWESFKFWMAKTEIAKQLRRYGIGN